MICKKCKSTNIKSRINYTHGRKSKGSTVLTCKDCGSIEMETPSRRYGRRNTGGRRR